MHRHSLFSSFSSLETLELKLSLTTVAPAVVATQSADDDGSTQGDPLPNPEPPPPPDPGNNPPVVFPALPTSGPPGPG